MTVHKLPIAKFQPPTLAPQDARDLPLGIPALEQHVRIDADLLVEEGIQHGQRRILGIGGVPRDHSPGGSWKHGIQIVLVEHVSRSAHADEDGAGVAVGEDVARAVEDPPAGHHVVFVGVAGMGR